MARTKRQSVLPRRAGSSWEAWRGEAGRCGECQTKRRPVARYAVTAEKDRWLCDRCVIEDVFAGIRYLPWEQREAYRDDPNAAYNSPPKEPALRPRPVVGQDRVEAALAAVGPAGWEEEDEDEGDDRRLRLSEARRLMVSISDRIRGDEKAEDEVAGLLRAHELVLARVRELGG